MAYNQTNSIYAQIKEKILNGEFKPAQNLTEKELSQQFNASRVTIKKALLMLENENLIENQENKSSRVRSFDVEEIVQFLQVRILLEGFCAQLTAPIISDEKISQMDQTLQVMRQMYQDGDLMGYSAKNVEFHKYIYDSCPNSVVVNLIWDIRNQISRYNFKTILVNGRAENSYKEHVEILESYRVHDSERARAATVTHVSNLMSTLEKNYKILFL